MTIINLKKHNFSYKKRVKDFATDRVFMRTISIRKRRSKKETEDPSD